MTSVVKELRKLFPHSVPLVVGRAASALFVAFAAVRRVFGVGEVIVPATICPEVPLAVLYAGLQPRFCDVELDTFCMSERTVRECLSPKTRAILVVHLFGKSADIEKIQALASQANVVVVEDLAQAIGGTRSDKMLGEFGDLAAVSFNGVKILPGCGGVLLVRQPSLVEAAHESASSLPRPLSRFQRIELAQAFRNLCHGLFGMMRSKDISSANGFLSRQAENFRPLLIHRSDLPEDSIPVLLAGIEKLAEEKRKRQRFYDAYVRHLGVGVRYVKFDEDEMCWRLPLLVGNHQQQLSLIESIRARGQLVSDHYFPVSFLFDDGTTRNAREIGLRGLNLWVNGQVSLEWIPWICQQIREVSV